MFKRILRKMISSVLVAAMLMVMVVNAVGMEAFAKDTANSNSDYGNFGGVIYYVDSVAGNDENNGTTESSAWKSLDKVNQQEYQPGDQILFKSGGVWSGRLMPKGSGIDGKPIIIGKYGGDARPIINGSSNLFDGSDEGSTVLLYNQEYWEIYDLEITNKSSSSRAWCLGIWVVNQDYGAADHFVVSNCYIHDLTFNARTGETNTIRFNNGTVDTFTREGSPKAAICFSVLVGGEKIPSKFNDVRVVNNEVANVPCTGFNIGSDWSDHQAHGYLDDEMEQLYFSTNIYVANNIFRNTAAAVTLFQVDGSVGSGCIVERNVCYDNNNGNSFWVMWSSSTIDLVYQYNEVYNMYQTSGSDDGLFDCDGQSVGTVFQYNYTHHNAGPVFVFCNIEWDPTDYPVPYVRSCAYRYNISYNDNWLGLRGQGIFKNVGDGNGYIYNNLVYTEGYDVILFDMYGADNYIANNIFYSTGNGTVTYKCKEWEGLKTNVINNCFYGLSMDLPQNDEYTNAAGNFIADPKLYLPQSTEAGDKSGISIGLASITDILEEEFFTLQSDSPCIGAGTVIGNNGGRDFFGNLVSATETPDVGPHQYTEVADVSGELTLIGSEVTTETVSLNWKWSKKQTASISKYEIYLDGELNRTIHSLHRKTSDFDLIGPKEGNVEIFATNSMVLEELIPGTTYEIAVRAYSGKGNYIESNSISVTTMSLQSGEENLQLSELVSYKYDSVNNTDSLCSSFDAEETIRYKTRVTDGAGRPVKGAVVHVIYEAEGLEYAAYDVAISDSNGEVWVGCRAPYLPKTQFNFTATVWKVEKAGYNYSGNPSVTVALKGYDAKYNGNLVANSDFSEVSGKNLPSGWGHINSGYISLVNTQGPEKQQNVLEFRSDNAVSAQSRQSISNIPNGTYTLTAWVRNTNTTATLGVLNTGSDVSIAIPVDEEWTQVVLDNVVISTNNAIVYVTVPMFGDYDDYTQVCNIELTRNLLYNTDITVIHPTSNLQLPADFYYITENGTVNVGDTDFTTADQDVNLQAVGVQYYAGENIQNALHVSSEHAFDFVMGQKKTSLTSGEYTFSASASRAGQIEGVLRIRDGVSGEVLNSTKITAGERYEMVKVTAEVTSGSAYVELCFKGEGSKNEYIDVVEMSFANRSDIAGDKTLTVLPGQNLFDDRNGDFEDEGKATNTVPNNWFLNDNKGYVDAYVVDEDKHTGDYCLKFTLDEEGYYNLNNAQYSSGGVYPTNSFSNLPGGTYTFSVWIRTNCSMTFSIKTDSGARAYQFKTTADDKWHEYTIENIVTKDGEITLTNWADRGTSSNPKDGSVLYAYMDTFRLVKNVDNNIMNGDAEAVSNGTPLNWTVAESEGHAKLITTKESVEGARAAMAVLPGTDSKLVFTCQTGEMTDGTYTFSTKIRGNGVVKLSITTDTDTEGYTLESTAGDDWKEIKLNHISVDSAVMKISITVENQSGSSSAFVSFDDMVLQESITSKMVAKLLPSVKGVHLGETLELPKPLLEGYSVSLYASSDTSVIATNGTVTIPETTKFVMLTFKVVNESEPEDVAYVSRYVTVYGWE